MIRRRELFLRALNALTRRSQDDRLRSEIAEHIALQTEDNVRAGMPLAEARRQAALKFGSIESHTESHRDQQSLPAMENFFRDAHYGVRMLRKSPGFTAVAVATLALGIGVTTAVFTVVNATLLRPFPSLTQKIW